MDAASVIGHFREEVFDEEAPHLWSDALVLRYLNDAQLQFCRDTEGLEATDTLTLPAGQARVTLDPRILKVRAARLGSRTLQMLSPEHVAGWSGSVGTPSVLIVRSRTDIEPWPTPVEDTAVELDVFRLPITTIESMGDDLEVEDMHERGLLMFMMHRAYARPDPETMDRTKSEFFRNEFSLYTAAARREQARRRHSAGATMFSW
jgi:hypothetical protein